MKLSFNRPADLLETFEQEDDFNFVESAIALQSPAYLDYFIKTGSTKLTIVDNSAYLKRKVPTTALLEICEKVSANVVIAPDVLGDPELTVQKAQEFIKIKRRISNPCYEIMGVAQGSNAIQKFRCAQQLAELGCHWIGVSHVLGSNTIQRSTVERVDIRIELVQELLSAFPSKKIHILGIADCWEVETYRKMQEERLISCDSAYAYLCAANLQSLPIRKPKERTTFADLLMTPPHWDSKNLDVFKHNIAWMKGC